MTKILFILLALLLTCVVFAAPSPTPSAAIADTDTPAVVVVRQFLVDRTAGKYDAAYALLSASYRQQFPAKAFEVGHPLSQKEIREMPAPLVGLGELFIDTHDTIGYTFNVVGPDPTDPNVVLVRANPPAGAINLPAIIVRLLTVSDPVAHAPRINVMGSFAKAALSVYAHGRELARQASQLNLKHLALGILLYTQDHKALMPDAAHWVDQIMPYVKDKAFFHDPSAPANQVWSYAYNRTLSHKSLDQFDIPSTTVLLFESSNGVKNASDTGQSVPRPGWHEGGTDFAFIDGHVKWFPDGMKLSYSLNGK